MREEAIVAHIIIQDDNIIEHCNQKKSSLPPELAIKAPPTTTPTNL